MTPADLAPLGSQQAAQHPRTCERELQMQLVEPPHQRKVRIRYGHRFVVDAASAEAEERRLLRQRKVCGYGRSSLCARKSRLAERTF